MNNPNVINLKVKNIKELPEELIQEKGFENVNKFLKQKADWIFKSDSSFRSGSSICFK